MFIDLSLLANQKDIYELMLKDDYISAYLLVESPGKAIYSAGGHVALRMSCPLKDVDYTYEFDAVIENNQSLARLYLNGNLKGEYLRLLTSDFLKKADFENRIVNEYQLNLTPNQEVLLWNNLDELVDGKSDFPFTPSKYNCCSMILFVIESSVNNNLFSSPDNSTSLYGPGRKYLEDLFSASPWSGVLWNILLGCNLDQPALPINLFYPKMIGKQLSSIRNPVNGKPIIDYQADEIGFIDKNQHVLSPSKTFILLFSMVSILTLLNIKGRAKIFARWLDVSLIIIISIVGCILWYMFFASITADELHINYLMLIFTPIPVLLVIVKKRKLWIVYLLATSLLSFLSLVFLRMIPQLQLYNFWLFIAIILERCLFHIYAKKQCLTQ